MFKKDKKIEDLDKQFEKGKKRKHKKKIIAFSIGGVLLVIAGVICAFLIVDKIEEVKKEKPKKEVEEVKKLTIVDQDSNARPIAVMLDTNIGNESHAGLQESYINYEIIVEGGLTRIMALFKDKDVSLIGPVRSSRHYFVDYSSESDALYIHFGWSPQAETDIKRLAINNINGLYDDAFWRDRNIAAPHNVFTSTETIYEFAKDRKNYQITTDNWWLLNYTVDEVKFPEPKKDKETGEIIEEDKRILANTINIPYSYAQNRSYIYDSERKVYLRHMNNKPHLDKTTKETLHYKNIIVEKVTNTALDREGRQELATVGTGTGYYITDGYAMDITWTKNTRTGKTDYKFLDGTEVSINDGNTFIQIVPINSAVTFE